MARALALPPALENLARELGLKHQKDASGARVMVALSRPRKPRAGEDPNGVYFNEDPEKLEQLYAYNRADVEATRELYNVSPPLRDFEQKLWALSEQVNVRGFHIDRAFAEAAQRIADGAQPEFDAELAQLTGGACKRTTEVAKLCAWLASQDVLVDALDKKNVARLLAGNDLTPAVRRALELRVAGGQAAFRKITTLLAGLGTDGRYRDWSVFHAASTGRYSGSRFQPQNLKRIEIEDTDTAIALVATGDYQQVRAKFPNPLGIVGQCLRATIAAPAGKVLIGADFSGIESRVTAWLANDQAKLEVFRKFDRTHDPLDDVYVVLAAKMFGKLAERISKSERQVGKFCELAFGFAGGVGAFRRLSPPEVNNQFTDDQVDRLKFAWRAAHPRIEALWHALNRAAVDAVRHPGHGIRCGRVAFESDDAPFLWLTLPSGRQLAYPQARIAQDEIGRASVTYKDNSAGQWRDERMYGGKYCENLAQAIARDLLTEAMLRLDAAGFEIVLHVHDEIACEVREGSDNIAEFTELMTAVPTWAGDLPVAAKAWSGERYTK